MARPRKPTALKLITGNPGRRPLSKQEPDPTYLREDEPAPAWLSDAAASVWRELAPAAIRTRLVTEVDVQAFAMGCTAIAAYRQATVRVGERAVKARPLLRDDGSPVLDGEGNCVFAGDHVNAWAMVQSMAFKQAMAVLSQFGLTPQARTRIALNPQGDLFTGDGTSAKYFN